MCVHGGLFGPSIEAKADDKAPPQGLDGGPHGRRQATAINGESGIRGTEKRAIAAHKMAMRLGLRIGHPKAVAETITENTR